MSRKRVPKLKPIEEVKEGTYLWKAKEQDIEQSHMFQFRDWLNETYQLELKSYDDLWKWSIEYMPDFWESIYRYFPFDQQQSYEQVMTTRQMPKTKWFTAATINYAQHVLQQKEDTKIAIYSKSETRTDVLKTWGELKADVVKLATYLKGLGVEKGDRVAGYLPNIYESVVSLLATASIGAIWTSVSPSYGLKSVVERFTITKPKVVIAVGGYTFGGEQTDRREDVRQLKSLVPSIESIIFVPYVFAAPKNDYIHLWPEIMNHATPSFSEFSFEEMEFNEALWILFSSGTSGIPESVVHSHGGITLEMYKLLHLHMNISQKDTVFFHTMNQWFTLNTLTSSLMLGATIVMYDGRATHPDSTRLFEIAESTRATYLAIAPAYINHLNNQKIVPKELFNLSKLKAVLVTGRPVIPEIYHWLYEHVNRELWVTSQSGGTSLSTNIVTSSLTEEVRAGEIQVRALGASAYAFDEQGRRVYDEMGELVITEPMPSMPIYLWNDETGAQYEDSYFNMYRSVWRHGDYIKIKSNGSSVIYGRSDSTLNRGGLRIGTNEIYAVVEALPIVKDSLVVHVDLRDDRPYMPLFVQLSEGAVWSDSSSDAIKKKIEEELTPMHVPDDVFVVNDIPYTMDGKKIEVPIRRIFRGEKAEHVTVREAMQNPDALKQYIELYETTIKEIKDAKA